MKKLASIVIVTYNRLEFTRMTIDRIFRNTKYPNYELIVVDNGSTDGTVQYLKRIEKKSRVSKVIYSRDNLGKGRAANKGFALSTGQYIIGLDDDMLVPMNWLTDLVNAIDIIPNVGWLSINLENFKSDPGCQFAPQYERKFGSYTVQETPGVGGFCVAMARSTYQRLGGYIESTKYGLEDAEYNNRARSHGLLTGYLIEVVGVHLGSTEKEEKLYPGYSRYKQQTLVQLNQNNYELARKDFFKDISRDDKKNN